MNRIKNRIVPFAPVFSVLVPEATVVGDRTGTCENLTEMWHPSAMQRGERHVLLNAGFGSTVQSILRKKPVTEKFIEGGYQGA